jgi:hypothetical protein
MSGVRDVADSFTGEGSWRGRGGYIISHIHRSICFKHTCVLFFPDLEVHRTVSSFCVWHYGGCGVKGVMGGRGGVVRLVTNQTFGRGCCGLTKNSCVWRERRV